MRGFKWNRTRTNQNPFFLKYPPKEKQIVETGRFVLPPPKPIIPGANITEPAHVVFRDKLRRGYAEWFSNRERYGCLIYSITFVFDGNRAVDPTLPQMMDAIRAYYSALLTQLYRRPNSKNRCELPLLLAHAENPSLLQKSIKRRMKKRPGESGIHYHGFLATHPFDATTLSDFLKALRHFIRAHRFAVAKARKHPSFLVRGHLEPTDSAEAWSHYITKQRTFSGEHSLDQYDIIEPRTVAELQSYDKDLRRPRPKRKTRKKSPLSTSRLSSTHDTNLMRDRPR